MTRPPVTIGVDHPKAGDPDWLRWLRQHGIRPNDTVEVTIEGDGMMVTQYVRSKNRRTLLFSDGSGSKPVTTMTYHKIWWEPPL